MSTFGQRVPIKGSEATTFSANITTYSHTISSTPGSALRSPGGSIIAGYEPDPFLPQPRAFESLASYPLSPSQLATMSRISLGTGIMAFVPEENPSQSGHGYSWTLESYHLPRIVKTPDPTGLVTSPPSLIPTGLPLPPTPLIIRRDFDFDWPGAISNDMLIGETDWVEVEADGDELDGWGNSRKGVGLLAFTGVIVCHVSVRNIGKVLMIGVYDSTP